MRRENQWQQFEQLKLEYYYKKFHSDIVSNFNKKKKQDIENYKNKTTSDYPRSIKKNDLNKLSDNNRIFLDNSYQLWMETKKVSELIKPIIFYYSWQQFAAFFIYNLFKWPNPASGHGMRYISGNDPDNLQEVMIEQTNGGFFRRLVDSFVILGHPSAYAKYVPLTAESGITYRKNEIETKIPIGLNNFIDILNFDSRIFANNFKHQFPKNYYGQHVDILLTDFLIIFVASNIARYRPKLWNIVLDGKGQYEAKFKSRVETAYNDFNINLNSFLNEVKNELWRWKSGPTPFSAPKDF